MEQIRNAIIATIEDGNFKRLETDDVCAFTPGNCKDIDIIIDLMEKVLKSDKSVDTGETWNDCFEVLSSVEDSLVPYIARKLKSVLVKELDSFITIVNDTDDYDESWVTIKDI